MTLRYHSLAPITASIGVVHNLPIVEEISLEIRPWGVRNLARCTVLNIYHNSSLGGA